MAPGVTVACGCAPAGGTNEMAAKSHGQRRGRAGRAQNRRKPSPGHRRAGGMRGRRRQAVPQLQRKWHSGRESRQCEVPQRLARGEDQRHRQTQHGTTGSGQPPLRRPLQVRSWSGAEAGPQQVAAEAGGPQVARAAEARRQA
eukprot:CAMPEP_0171064218 /NCGR_PEP_ID=MMETSP0766_2-20121228/6146_1 /TAXON_ID=439317 /ORGANISM="Gambierdiscus australes, Strain CAWD 149" /LENGTH=142 /DNA_ID=CAMNT_0011520223 /DNA_START=298 /DNA_END=727 /DNA_ORIENTATION=+